ncbi:DUF559 domain-containing protein [Nitrosomonas sp.]|uniref:DUF559 domain-containing protein n=1 Tax=Nitrosomonas sp. TaxID=42353 RepID=UPI00260DCAA9|nr:DUF559 domain-containing protein [Nitrosomonas sp.]MCW5600906.1 DUF559 domain-containing protein [Nitrosomonas sp.]
MKDNPTPTLPLSGEGVKPQSSPLSGEGVKPQSSPLSEDDVKPQFFSSSGDGVKSPSSPPVSGEDVKTVAVDESNAADAEQHQNTTPPPDKGEAGRVPSPCGKSVRNTPPPDKGEAGRAPPPCCKSARNTPPPDKGEAGRVPSPCCKSARNTPPPGKGEAGRGLKHPRLHNLKSQLNNRRRNRKNPTEPEQRFWSWVRGEQLGCKFRRQHSIGKYIVDFYCAEHALIIELDGDSHYTPGAMAYDQERTDYLIAKGFTVLRFTNFEVMQNKEGVLQVVLLYLEIRGDNEENS